VGEYGRMPEKSVIVADIDGDGAAELLDDVSFYLFSPYRVPF
jgi:hypothetical protein